MTSTYIGTIDQGTRATRFVVFDHDGRVVASAREEHEQITPEPAWVEHDPGEIWENVEAVATTALDRARLDASRLDAIGIANQRETTVVWDADSGEPVHNALVWRDRRTAGRVEALQGTETAELIRERTGLEPDAYFSATKVEWILDNVEPARRGRAPVEDLRDRAENGDLLMGTIDAWLVYKLTGNHVTDVSNASRTMLYDIHHNEWDDDLLAAFGVPRSMLPDVRPSSDEATYGSTDADGFLGAAVPVAGALGDQQAALLGQGCFEPGEVKNTYGVGSFCLMNTGEEAVTSEHGLLTTVGFQLSGEPVQYALEGPVFATGVTIEWLEAVGLIDDAGRTVEVARSVDSTGGLYLVPAFAGLGAPHWNSRSRGTIVGMGLGTRRAHVARAALESIAYRIRDVAEPLAADSGVEVTALRVSGGAARNDFFCQLQSDVLQADVVRPVVDETTALGAAYAAGLAVGYWDTLDELRDHWRADRVFHPKADPEHADRQYGRWEDAVVRSLDWATGETDGTGGTSECPTHRSGERVTGVESRRRDSDTSPATRRVGESLRRHSGHWSG